MKRGWTPGGTALTILLGLAGLITVWAAGKGLLAPGASTDAVIRANNHGVARMEQFKHKPPRNTTARARKTSATGADLVRTISLARGRPTS